MNTLSNFSKYEPIARNLVIGAFLLTTLTMLRNLGFVNLSDTQFASVEAWLYAAVDVIIVVYLAWNARKNSTSNARVEDIANEKAHDVVESVITEMDSPEFAEKVRAELAG